MSDNGWLPIDSVPPDTRVLLVIRRDGHEDYIDTGWWSSSTGWNRKKAKPGETPVEWKPIPESRDRGGR
jgi:hypothetical protein